MTDSRSIIGIFIFIGILLFAVWLGTSIVTSQIETLVYFVGGALLISCALLGRRIWMILPFAAALNLSLRIPGQPDTLLLAQALFIGFCVLQFFIRKLHVKIRITELEIWVVLIVLCLFQVYLRNPVGLNIFGGNTMGGKPYLILSIALLSNIILGSLIIPARDLLWIVRLSIFGGLLNFTLSTIGYFIPKIGVWYGAANLSYAEENLPGRGEYNVDRADRVGFLGQASGNLSLWISTFISPIRACLHPLWAPLILLTLAFAALSGFRNQIAIVGLTYIVGMLYRSGFPSVLIASMGLIFGIAFLAFVNLAIPLPANVQRSLSFLPGTWDDTYVADAKGSTDWRVVMWKEALLTDNWIENKWLGDGLGMTRKEHDYMASFGNNQTTATHMIGNLSLQQEMMMAANNYHSGPVSTIRTIGYLGFFILITALIRLAVHAHRQIQRAKNTIWFPLTLFIGIPLIFGPFFWVFIMGSFNGGIYMFLSGAAMIRLLEVNLPLPAYVVKKSGPYVLKMNQSANLPAKR